MERTWISAIGGYWILERFYDRNNVKIIWSAKFVRWLGYSEHQDL